MQGTTKGIPMDTDANMAANSDQLVPTQKAVKTALEKKVAAQITVYNVPGKLFNYYNFT